MKIRLGRFLVPYAIALATTGQSAWAAPVTSITAFLAGISGTVGSLNFDTVAADTDLSGSSLAFQGGYGISLQFPASMSDENGFAVRPKVIGGNPSSSSPNSLGTDDIDNFNLFTAGTRFSLGLNLKVSAFGLSIITPDQMFDDDIRLLAGGDITSLSVADRSNLGNFGGVDYFAYFLGVVNAGPFDTVAIDYGPFVVGGPFLYSIDDIRVADATSVSEPGSSALVALALTAGVCGRRRKLTGSRRSSHLNRDGGLVGAVPLP